MRLLPLASAVVSLSLACAASAQTAPAAGSDPNASPPSELEAGGLAPPEAVEAPPATDPNAPNEAQVERELEQADEEDTGRGLEFVWLNGEIGYQVAGLQTLSDSDLVDGTFVENNQSGLMYGGGAGVRLFVVTIGARFRYMPADSWNMWSLNAEGALRIPLGDLEIYALAGGGYVSVGGFTTPSEPPGNAVDLSGMSAQGIDFRLGGGLDYYPSSTFSIGVNVTGEAMILGRSAQSGANPDSVYASDGSSVGAAFTASAVIGLHF